MGAELRWEASLAGDVLDRIRSEGLSAMWKGGEGLAGGRGTARNVRVEDLPFLIKRESRGGLAARILPDRYVTRAPFDREWSVTNYLADRGLAPRILAREYIRRGLLLSVYSLFQYVPDARSLAEAVGRDGIRPEDLTVAGRGVGLLHKAGVLHADLNAGNVLLAAAGPLLIDFRHSIRTQPAPSPSARRHNLDRLARSLHKIRIVMGLSWNVEPWEALAEGYARGWGSRDPWLPEWVSASRRPPSRLRRLAW